MKFFTPIAFSKKSQNFLFLFMLLSAFGWAQTGTLTITRASFSSPGDYGSNDTWNATTSESDVISGACDIFGSTTTSMQVNPGNASSTKVMFYNSVVMPGPITKITMTKASGTDRSWTPYLSTGTVLTLANYSTAGTAQTARTVSTTPIVWNVTEASNFRHFYLHMTAGATNISSIVIEYTIPSTSTPNLNVTNGDVAFGSVCTNATPVERTYTVTNTGGAAATGVTVTSNNSQYVVSNVSGTSIAATSGTLTYKVTYTPTTGSAGATITIGYTGGSKTSTLTGTAVTPVTPIIVSNDPTAVSATSATFNGNLTAGVCPATTEKGFVWALTSNISVGNPLIVGSSNVTKQPVAGVTGGSFTYTNASTALTSYSYRAYEYNGSSYIYGDTKTFSTPAAVPTVAATAFTVVQTTVSSINFSWTNGNGARRIVVARSGASNPVAPTNGTIYAPLDSDFSNSGNPTTAAGSVVVYDGTGNSVDVTGLTANTQYSFRVYEYNGSTGTSSYLASATFTRSTLFAEPTAQPTAVTIDNIDLTTFRINWTGGNGANSLVVVKQGSAVDAVPVDGTTYTAGTTFGNTGLGSGNSVVYRSNSNTVTVTGLTASTTYHIAVFEYNGGEGSEYKNYMTATPATASAATATPPANDNCGNAEALTVNVVKNGTLAGSSFVAPFNATTVGDVWYSFTPSWTAAHTITLSDFLGDADLFLYNQSSACPTTTTNIGFSNSTNPVEAISDINLTVGVTYYIRVSAYDAAAKNTFKLIVTSTQPSPTIYATPSTVPAMTATVGEASDTEVIAISGALLEAGITVSLSDAINYSISHNSFPSTGGNLTITYHPTTAGSHPATVTLTSTGANPLELALSGTAGLKTPLATAATDESYNSFIAHWGTVAGALQYSLNVNTLTLGAVSGVETFEAGLDTGGYETGFSAELVGGTWISDNVLRATGANAYAGSYAAQLQSSGGKLTSPAVFDKLSSITFYAKGGSLNISKKIGATTTSVQTVALTGSFAPYTVNINEIANDVQLIITNGSGVSYLDQLTINYQNEVATPIPGSPFTINAPTTSYLVTGLDAASAYQYSVTAISGAVSSSASNFIPVVTSPAPVTWNGNEWSNVTGPTSSIEAIIEGNFNTNDNDVFIAKKLTLNSGLFTIKSGDNITVVNGVVNNTAASNFVIENNANLLQNGTVNANSGSITVKRNSASIKRQDYTLWSSPVSGQGLYAFSPFTFPNRFYTYSSTSDTYVSAGINPTGLNPDGVNGTDLNNVPFSPATGYLIRVPWNHPTTPAIWTGTFTGIPNSGDVPVNNLTTGRYYAIGNPYPSTISANQFIIDNNIGDNPENPGDGLYFWRKTNNATQASYATYTTAGGVESGGDTLNIEPNGIIQVGQGFIVRATSPSLIFNNNQRRENNADQFLKNIERNRIWLRLSEGANLVNGMMVAYMTGATQNVDPAIDGRYFNDSPTALNSLVNDQEFAIQGRSLPFDSSDIVPLAFKAAADGTFTIALDQVDGLFTAGAQSIYLKDNATATVHDLNNSAYTFTSTAGTFNGRFELVYQSQLVNPIFTADTVVIYNQNNEFVINTGNTVIADVKVFDIRGRLLLEKTNVNDNQATIGSGTANGVLLVQIKSVDGSTVTKKVIK